MVRGGTTYRLITDWRGSVRAVVDAAAGTVIQTTDYDPWGNPTLNDTTCATGAVCALFQPFGFAGGLFDRETGLVRFGTRDYDPSVGRWGQKDPIGFDGGQWNIYAYAGADPINGSDPRGKDLCSLNFGLDCAADCLIICLIPDLSVVGGIACNLVCNAACGEVAASVCSHQPHALPPPPPPPPPSCGGSGAGGCDPTIQSCP